MSPKGNFRLWPFTLVAVVFLSVASSQSAATEYVWLWETMSLLGKVGMGGSALYYLARNLTHTRTHELVGEDKSNRENILILAAGLVLCGIFSGY